MKILELFCGNKSFSNVAEIGVAQFVRAIFEWKDKYAIQEQGVTK